MRKRFYDKNRQYTEGFLKEYKHWILEVSYRQHTLGSFIIFSKRKGVENITQLTDAETVELKEVMQDAETALGKNPLFQPDKFNYWQMGNKLKHLHFHGIPRYKDEREFAGRIWKDKTYGNVPVWSKKDEKHQLVKAIRESLKKFL